MIRESSAAHLMPCDEPVVPLPLEGLSLLPAMPASGGDPYDGAPAALLAREVIAEADRRVATALSMAAGTALDLLDRWIVDELGADGTTCVVFHGPRGVDATDAVWVVTPARPHTVTSFVDCPVVPDVHSTLGTVASRSLGADLSGPLIAVPRLHLFATLVWDQASSTPQLLDALRVAGAPGQTGRLSGLTGDEWGWLDEAERRSPDAFTFDPSLFA